MSKLINTSKQLKSLAPNEICQKTPQDGRLAPAYFSPNCKYFDQLLQTVKNKTTVLTLVFTNDKSFYKHQFDH